MDFQATKTRLGNLSWDERYSPEQVQRAYNDESPMYAMQSVADSCWWAELWIGDLLAFHAWNRENSLISGVVQALELDYHERARLHDEADAIIESGRLWNREERETRNHEQAEFEQNVGFFS